jgi:nucleoside-diphosphate-sugar epimerase
MKVLITGASGFVGHALCKAVGNQGFEVVGASRQPTPDYSSYLIKDIGDESAWVDALQNVDVVVHLAARAHIMEDKALNPYQEYWRVNVEGTRALLKACHQKKVKRFIYISSIKVNGDETSLTQPFTADSLPAPTDDYGRSKWAAEQLIHELCQHYNIEFVILRPPLVYGPGVKGNFLSLLKLCYSGLPLPFGAIKNKRSLIFLDNLTSAIIKMLSCPQAVGKTYLVCDDHDLSTSELIRQLRMHMGKKARLWPIPVKILDKALYLARRSKIITRLTGSLRVDDSKIRQETGWVPPVDSETGLGKTVEWFLKTL